MKILAVDDDPDILQILRVVLCSSGYSNFTSATSAAEAARLIMEAAQPFDCFLLDIQMPEFNGIDLCRRIRKLAKHRTTPILMITAMKDKSYVDRAFLAGATDYVTKPIDLTELAARMRSAEQMILADRKLQEAILEAEDVRAQLEGSFKMTLADAVTIDDVDGLIDLLALENYLLQLSRGDLHAANVIAFHIHEVGDLYAQSSPTLFRDILADVAESALAALCGTNCLMAYAGNGTFVGITSHTQTLDADETELLINGILSGLQMLDDHGKMLDVKIAVGNPRPIGLIKSGKGAVNMLRAAVADVRWAHPRAVSRDLQGLTAGGNFLKTLFRRIG